MAFDHRRQKMSYKVCCLFEDNTISFLVVTTFKKNTDLIIIMSKVLFKNVSSNLGFIVKSRWLQKHFLNTRSVMFIYFDNFVRMEDIKICWNVFLYIYSIFSFYFRSRILWCCHLALNISTTNRPQISCEKIWFFFLKIFSRG